MPGPVTHLVVEQRLSAYLRRLGGEEGVRFAEILDRDPVSPFSGFGCQGPDFLTFSLGEYEGGADQLANFLFAVYDALRPLISFYETTIEPVVDDLERAIINHLDGLFAGLFSDIGDTVDQLTTTAMVAVEATVTNRIDLFYPFFPKIQQGQPENRWFWFDTLHYRRTGEFANNLWELAGRDEDLQRYAIGYGSHIGTDVGAHPYVNSLVGGPYRMHWHRHHLIENWIDASVRQALGDVQSTIEGLRLTGEDNYQPDSVSSSYYYRLCRFNDDGLPGKLSELFSRAMKETYAGTDHPRFLSPDDIDTAYRLWFGWFEYATGSGDAKRPQRVARPGDATNQLINDFIQNLPDVQVGPAGGSFSIQGIFEAALRFLEDLFDALVYTIEWAIENAGDIVRLPETEAIALLKWLLYQIHMGLWTVYDTIRFRVMVLGGYFFPEPRDLSKHPWASAFLDTRFVQLTGGAQADFGQYPRNHHPHHGLFGTTEHHLRYPGTVMEYPQTESAPIPFEGIEPRDVIAGEHAYDSYIEHLYRATGPYGTTNDYSHYVNEQSWNTAQFGSALCFTARLLGEGFDNLPNFNLDSDRGYGWLAWRASDPENIETNNPVDTSYIDD